MSDRSREPFAVVGAAQRQAIDRALAAQLSAMELRTFLAVLHVVTSWSRLVDLCAVRQIALIVYDLDKAEDVSGWQRKRVRRWLARLADADVIVYEPGVGRSALARVGIPRFDENGGSPKLPFDDLKGGSDALPSRGEGSALVRERGAHSAVKGGSFRGKGSAPEGPHREVSEKTSEKKHASAARTRATTPARRRDRDLLFEAVVDCWGLDPAELTRNERGKVNAAVKQLREVDADPAEVPRRRQVYRQRYRDAADTPLALVGHWSECATLDDHAPARMSADAVSVARAAVDLERERQRRR